MNEKKQETISIKLKYLVMIKEQMKPDEFISRLRHEYPDIDSKIAYQIHDSLQTGKYYISG